MLTMCDFVDSDVVDDCIQLLVHEYINNWSSFRRVFNNLASPNLGRVEAIYAHKMHDVIIQILSSKGVVVKNISRPITNAVLKQMGLDPHRKEVVYLEEFLNHIRPKLSFGMFENNNNHRQNRFLGCPTPPSSRMASGGASGGAHNSKSGDSKSDVTVSGDARKNGNNLRKKLSHIPVLQNNPSKSSIPRPPSSSRRSRSRTGSTKGSVKDKDKGQSSENYSAPFMDNPKHLHRSRPQSRSGSKTGSRSQSKKSVSENSTSSQSKYKVDDLSNTTKQFGSTQTTHSSANSSRPSSSAGSRNVTTPVFHSFCERSSSLGQRTVCISPCYNLSTDFEPIGRTVQTTDSSAQTIITMDIFSTNRSPENKKNSKSGSIRMRGKSQSPRTRVPSGERPRSSAGIDEPSGKSERSSLREGGESLKRMLLPWKKLIPWKRNSNSSSSAATSPRHVENKSVANSANEEQTAPAAKGDHERTIVPTTDAKG